MVAADDVDQPVDHAIIHLAAEWQRKIEGSELKRMRQCAALIGKPFYKGFTCGINRFDWDATASALFGDCPPVRRDQDTVAVGGCDAWRVPKQAAFVQVLQALMVAMPLLRATGYPCFEAA